MIRRMLVAVDDSPRAAWVVERAAEVVLSAGASVRLYHSVAIPPEFPPAAATDAGDPLPAYLHRVARDKLNEFVKNFAAPCDVVVDDSQHAAQSILGAADAYDADLIVIGSHGFTFVDHFLGTTAAQVVNRSTRDVLVVHRTGPSLA